MNLSRLCNLYWMIRYHRKKNSKRKYYYQIAAEKKRLVELGADREELRLLCRVLANRHNVHAARRLEAYRKDQIANRISCGNFYGD